MAIPETAQQYKTLNIQSCSRTLMNRFSNQRRRERDFTDRSNVLLSSNEGVRRHDRLRVEDRGQGTLGLLAVARRGILLDELHDPQTLTSATNYEKL